VRLCVFYVEPLPHICLHKLERENLLFSPSLLISIGGEFKDKSGHFNNIAVIWTLRINIFFFKPFPNNHLPKILPTALWN